jgi:hypothetical protein
MKNKLSDQFQNLTEKFQKQRQNHDPHTDIHGCSNLVL